jgi:GNAT superfamily N-acetyltransferase
MLTDCRIEPLSSAAIPDNVALAQAVGWPDDDADWRVIHEAALVLGARREGRLIAQGALGSYEHNAGTIAKMIVLPKMQRQGFGAAILDALLAEAELRSLTTLGLVATPLGQTLYESRGFAVTGEVVVFIGTPVLERATEFMPPITDIESVVAFERRLLGCARATMLRARQREASASAVHGASDGGVRGFAIATPKAPYALVGPVIAEAEDVARRLVRSIFAANPGVVRIDVPSHQMGFCRWLRGLGLHEKGVRPEMARGGGLPWQVPQRFALATQAWG